ncbi:hypothetical protein GCM10010517_16730 [Streptosporangium fragile]|uniref:Uncharacterized protein n=1 Tax=Streptosporangium fragile TaxID=46186 RepID=A0ABN3VSV5_9ACTN
MPPDSSRRDGGNLITVDDVVVNPPGMDWLRIVFPYPRRSHRGRRPTDVTQDEAFRSGTDKTGAKEIYLACSRVSH